MDLEAAAILLYSGTFRTASPLHNTWLRNAPKNEDDDNLLCALSQLEDSIDESEDEDRRAEEVHSRPPVIPVRPVPLQKESETAKKMNADPKLHTLCQGACTNKTWSAVIAVKFHEETLDECQSTGCVSHTRVMVFVLVRAQSTKAQEISTVSECNGERRGFSASAVAKLQFCPITRRYEGPSRRDASAGSGGDWGGPLRNVRTTGRVTACPLQSMITVERLDVECK